MSCHCLRCLCIMLHFVGSLSFCSQEADECPSPPQIFPRTKFKLISEDFFFYYQGLSPCIQHYWGLSLYVMCKISTEQKVTMYVLVRNTSSKQKFAQKTRNIEEHKRELKPLSVSHTSMKLCCFIKGSVHCPSRWQSEPSQDYQTFSPKSCHLPFYSCRRLKAEHKDGSFTLLMLLLSYLHTLTFAKCSRGKLSVFCLVD